MKGEELNAENVMKRLKERVEFLETRLRHMENDYEITKAENENSTAQYMEILAHLENLVADRTEQLEQKSAELQMMIDSTPSLFMSLDRQGRFLRVNRAFAQLLGLEMNKIIGRTALQLQPKQNPEFMTRNRSVVESGEAILQKEEQFIVGSRSLTLLIDRKPFSMNDETRGVVCFALDITRRRAEERQRLSLEKQMRQKQKMEAVGTLAGGIAHDFNNILAIIIGYAEMIAVEDEQLSTARGHAQEVLRASMRARDLIRQILTFSRQDEQERRPLIASHILKEAVRMMRASLPSTIRFSSEIDSSSVILADPSQIHQVVMNLCVNAWQSMNDEHGLLDIRLHDIPREEAPGEIAEAVKAKTLLRLQVRDTGCGIEESIIDRIYEPYFSTRKQGDGAGMGLSIVHGVITAYGGAIHCDTRLNEGTCFTIWLPTVEQAQANDIVTPLRHGKDCSASLLLIDDEAKIVDFQAESLQKYGYDVTTRVCGVEALKLIKNDPKRFDLVVTDLTMPNMNGYELTRQIHAIRPDIPVILCTGYSERLNEESVMDSGVASVLLKPLVTSELVREIERTLKKRP